MAEAAITLLELTTNNSTVSGHASFVAIDTATGAYIDMTGKSGKLIVMVEKTASNVAGDSLSGIRFDGGSTVAMFSNHLLGDLTVYGNSTALAAQGPIEFYGPIETARFADSDERIHISATFATNSGFVAAILLPD